MMRKRFVSNYHGRFGPLAWDVDLGQVPLPYFRFYCEGDEDVTDEVFLGIGIASHWGDSMLGAGLQLRLPRPVAKLVERVFGVRSV